MKSFLLRRAIGSLISLAGATFIVFAISVGADDPLALLAQPGGYGLDPGQVDVLRKKFALDRPLVVQWALWLGRALSGDMGRSLADNVPVATKIATRAGATVKLAVVAWVFATLIGVPIGVLTAVRRGSVWDLSGRLVGLIGPAIPSFWLAMVLVLIFSVRLNWLPSATAGEGFISVKHMVLPVLVLSLSAASGYIRITRVAMLEVLDSDFVRLARAKGVGRVRSVWKHALRAAVIQPLTVSGVMFAGFLTGSVVAETVFAWPGIGRLAVQAAEVNDFPVVAGTTLVFAALWVIVSFGLDMAYALVDPRVRIT